MLQNDTGNVLFDKLQFELCSNKRSMYFLKSKKKLVRMAPGRFICSSLIQTWLKHTRTQTNTCPHTYIYIIWILWYKPIVLKKVQLTIYHYKTWSLRNNILLNYIDSNSKNDKHTVSVHIMFRSYINKIEESFCFTYAHRTLQVHMKICVKE